MNKANPRERLACSCTQATSDLKNTARALIYATPVHAISPPEPAFLLVSTKNANSGQTIKSVSISMELITYIIGKDAYIMVIMTSNRS